MRPTPSLAFFVFTVCSCSFLTGSAPPAGTRSSIRGDDAAPLRAAAIAAIQGRADARYAFELRDGEHRARNEAESFDVRIDGEGRVALASSRGARVALSLRGLGRGETIEALAPQEVSSHGARVEIERERGVVEWYANGPLGLEQGFDLARRPVGQGELVIELDVDGAELEARGEGAVVLRAEGGSAMVYRDLVVADARGSVVPSRLAIHDGALGLRIDDAEAIYPLHVDPLIVSLEGTLADPDGDGGDSLGACVAVEGNVAVVGAPHHAHDGSTSRSGAAYVFVRDPATSTWSLLQELVPPEPVANGLFGTSVAIRGSQIVVGAPGAVQLVSNLSIATGAAYVFEKTGSGASSFTHAIGSPLFGPASEGNELGSSVAIAGGRIFVGAPLAAGLLNGAATAGMVVVFSAISPFALELPLLRASDGASGDRFGHSLAATSDANATFVVVGAPEDDVSVMGSTETDAGSAYVYLRPAAGQGMWSEHKLVAADASGGDEFGTSVAIVPSHVAVGAPLDDNANGSNAGAVYLFSNAMSSFPQLQKLLPPAGAGGDELGTSVTVQAGALGVLVLGGAPGARIDGGADPGRIFGFGSRSTTFFPLGAIDAPVVGGAELGASMAVDVTTLVVGAPLDDHHGVGEAGTARVFRLPEIRVVKVELAGAGEGSVTSAPEGIDCGSDCFEVWNAGTLVTLTPTPAAGSYFAGWSGACTGTGSCVLTVSADKTAIAAFEPLKPLGAECGSPLECQSGSCQGSVCVVASQDAGMVGDGGAGADAGVVAGPVPGFEGAGGCGCHVGGRPARTPFVFVLGLGLLLALRRRRPYL